MGFYDEHPSTKIEDSEKIKTIKATKLLPIFITFLIYFDFFANFFLNYSEETQNPKNLSYIIPIVLTFLFFYLFFWVIRKKITQAEYLKKHGSLATAKIISTSKINGTEIEFNGQKVKLKNETEYVNAAKYNIGDTVFIRYNRENLRDFIIEGKSA